MAVAQVSIVTLSCTPHFKFDAENAWVTKDSHTAIHYWLNPNQIQTLLQVAVSIESWAVKQQATQASGCAGKYSININSMQVHRTTYDRLAMASCQVSDKLSNEEPFNLSVHSSVTASCVIL